MTLQFWMGAFIGSMVPWIIMWSIGRNRAGNDQKHIARVERSNELLEERNDIDRQKLEAMRTIAYCAEVKS